MPATKKTGGLSDAEKAALRERTKELKAEDRMNRDRAVGEKAVMDAIAAMKGSDKAIAKRLHEIVKATAPQLSPKTWYGMPAYAKDGKVVCFFKAASKFDVRYAEFGFNEEAALDAGAMWPTAFAVKELNPAVEKQITALVKKAVR